jgi:hypothetical protein
MAMTAILEWSAGLAAYLSIGCVFLKFCELDARWRDTWPAIAIVLVFWLPWLAVMFMLDCVQERKARRRLRTHSAGFRLQIARKLRSRRG